MKRKFADYLFRSYLKRRIKNYAMCSLLALAAVLALIPLLSVFGYVLMQGVPGLSLDFFRSLPKPVGELGGGMANSIVGSAVLVLIASIVGVPWGMGIGIYLSEYGHGRAASFIRFCVDVLASIPSIIIGLFIYALVVVPMKRFSALAGGLALAVIMVPTVARTTEELLKMVPVHIREAGLALGLPRWKVILRIVVRGSVGAIMTGVMLSLGRAAGETAPLLFTAFNNRFWQRGLDQPISSLPVQIYNYAISPYEDWHRQAWTAALILVAMIFSANLVTRAVMRAKQEG